MTGKNLYYSLWVYWWRRVYVCVFIDVLRVVILKKKSSKSDNEKDFNEILLSHRLVPKHIILSEEEKKEVIEKFAGGDPYKLPYILVTDPVVKAIGAKPGDVIKIIRKSPTAGVSVYYRLVVK